MRNRNKWRKLDRHNRVRNKELIKRSQENNNVIGDRLTSAGVDGLINVILHKFNSRFITDRLLFYRDLLLDRNNDIVSEVSKRARYHKFRIDLEPVVRGEERYRLDNI